MEKFEQIGMDYILQSLELISPFGKKKIKNLEFHRDRDKLETEYENISKVENFSLENRRKIEAIKRKLKEIKDISSVIKRLSNNCILDDIDLFEIKVFSLISQEIKEILEGDLEFCNPFCLEENIKILDPDGNRIKSFYIYSSYSNELAVLRETHKRTKSEEIYDNILMIEEKIRKSLSRKLKLNSEIFGKNIDLIGYLELLIGKVELNKKLGLTRPTIGKEIVYKGLFHPKLENTLKNKGKRYQKIDINLGKDVTVITGANMSGKTVTLKAVGLCQYMAQTGFYVPADYAQIDIKDRLYVNIGDHQSIDKGLSSFAAEMKEIDEILKNVRNGEKPLVIIDEPARSTNPKEGKALVKSLMDIFQEYGIRSLISTHYDEVGDRAKRIRVKGLKNIVDYISVENIEEYIDYSLIDDEEGKVPEEALHVAKLLNIDEELVNRAFEYLKKEKSDV